MLEGYFDLDGATGDKVNSNRKRLLAVQAALEIAKSSVGSTGSATLSRVDDDLKYVSEAVSLLADAIEKALEK